MNKLRELAYYSFLAGLMLYGFFKSVYDHDKAIAIVSILLFSLDVWMALKAYDKVKEVFKNESNY